MTKNIMIQGTMSGAGKSLIACALCRIFTRRGFKTAPFKSQNMSLNSFVTSDGLEMGRAQVLQAQACGKEPDVRMNPVLLKPTSDGGSQVIVKGEVYGSYSASDYFRIKTKLIPKILGAYESLASENDIIVIEGAGSPAEINLKENDIVNMGLAKMLDAPVLLAGNIDPGGVFAQLYGTVMLLEKEERDRIKGLIINKFRGDVDILKPGLVMLEDLCRIPVCGVIPYIYTDLDDEDSLSESFEKKSGPGAVDAAVIRLPRISNFTDFAALEMHPDIEVRYVSDAGKLGDPDILILPGTKNTTGDLAWLKEKGFAEAVEGFSKKGKMIIGICGGYQMLGKSIAGSDDGETESVREGLGLLPVTTVYDGNKRRRRTKGVASAGVFAGARAEGYEIHMGRTCTESAQSLFQLSDGEAEGAFSGNVFGTYMHGLFDTGEIPARIADAVLAKKGLGGSGRSAESRHSHQEKELDRLADIAEKSLDIDSILEAMG